MKSRIGVLWSLAAAALGSFPATAAPLPEPVVRAAVETWVRSVAPDRRPDAVIERMEPHEVAGDTLAYIAHLAGGGFCLSGADDLVLPVTLYSPTGHYDQANPGCRAVLQMIARREAAFRKGLTENDSKLQPHRSALADRASRWRDLAARRLPGQPPPADSRSQPSSMNLGVSQRWNPFAWPYNAYCPPGDSSGFCEVGSGAMTASLVMNHWRWPPAGIGSEMYWWSGDFSCGGVSDSLLLYADFQDPYDWANMPEDCNDGCSDDQADAVAELCYETGIAAWTYYGYCHSDVVFGYDPATFSNNFYYDADVTWTENGIEVWTWELVWQRPIIVVVPDWDEGWIEPWHWVVYGYDKATDPNRSFLCNFGVPDMSDLWFTYDSIPLNVEGGYAIVHIAPWNVVRFLGENWTEGDGSPDSPFSSLGSALQSTPDGGTIILEAGFSAAHQGVITKPCILRGCGSTIQ